MTVKELIEKLQELDPDLHLFTSGYEGGFHYVEIGEPDTFYLNVNTDWYYGPHENSPGMIGRNKPDYKQVKGITL
jgi:hypothetical protein